MAFAVPALPCARRALTEAARAKLHAQTARRLELLIPATASLPMPAELGDRGLKD